MDGTLTIPNLDFAEMYRRANVDMDDDILEAINRMDDAAATHAKGVIEEMEQEGRRTLQLMPGAAETIQWLAAHSIPTALVTRNSARTAQRLVELLETTTARDVAFDHIITRDDEEFPPKPDPASFHRIATSWNVPTENLAMVGDSLSNDIVYGKRAGATTVLLDTGRQHSEEAHVVPDICIHELGSLPRSIWNNFEIDSPLGTHAQNLHGQAPPKPSTEVGQAAFRGDLMALETANASELSVADDSGNTSLIWAAEGGHVEAVKYILSKVPSIADHRGYLGATALCRAARLGNTQVLKLLIDSGVNLDLGNDKLQYPLHFAAFKQKQSAVELLLQANANTMLLDRKGRRPAEDTRCKTIRGMILEAMSRDRK